MAIELRRATDHPDLVLAFVEADEVEIVPAPADLVAALDAAVGRLQGVDHPPPAIRAAVRDLLRRGGFKPTGRSKPSSEYLARAAATGAFPRINAAVDAANLLSLETGIPLSLVDLDRAHGSARGLEVREGRPGERYVFNASGQEIDVGGLLGVARVEGPLVANPVKDSLETKIDPATRRVLGVLYGTRALWTPETVEAWAETLGRRLETYAGARDVRVASL